MIKAIQIDVQNKEINEVEKNSLQDIYKYVNCQTFDVVYLSDELDCYVDDESLIKAGYIDEDGTRHNLSGFKIQETLIMGNGLIVGTVDDEGDTTDCPISKEEVEKMVTFVDFDREEDRPQPFMQFISWE
jgi:hypothetical protein